MEARRRTGWHRCVEPVRPIEGRPGPPAGTSAERFTAANWPAADRSPTAGAAALYVLRDAGGTERDAVTHFLERARARGRGTGGVAGGWSA